MPKYLLIIATSARYIAQMAHFNGFKPLIIDVFIDEDTKEYAHAYQRVNSLALHDLIPALTYFLQHYPIKYCLYGSGFENHINSLLYLEKQLILLGNDSDTFQKVQNKRYFFDLLTKLAIAFPQTHFTKPSDIAHYLIKPLCGQGGVGISYYTHQQINTTHYWQKYQKGLAHSVLFLANGYDFKIIGFNTQWTIDLGNEQAFIFSGIINATLLNDKHKNTVITWLTQLMPVLKLKGLNSLDFICDGNNCYCLEINARLSASIQLYSADILIAHSKACEYQLINYNYTQLNYTAYQIIYAPQQLIIPNHFNWKKHYCDIPPAGSYCDTNQAICSMIVSGYSLQNVFKQLQQGQHFILSQLFRGLLWQTTQASINYPKF